MATAAVASVLLAGSALVAIPADAATVSPHTVYASELLGSTQSFTVGSGVAKAAVEVTPFQSPVSASTALSSGSSAAKPGSGVSITVGGHSNADWAALVLQDANLPVTSNNVTVLLQWMDSENSPNSWWLRNNPLNNGLGSGGGAGFGSYPNLETAATYVAQQLGRSLFSGIAASLASNSSPSVTEQAIIASPWATSHYGYGSSFHAVNVPIVQAPASSW